MKKNIVIIILSVVILGLGGYLVYDKVLSDDNKESNNKVEESNNEELIENKQEENKEKVNKTETQVLQFYPSSIAIVNNGEVYVNVSGSTPEIDNLYGDGTYQTLIATRNKYVEYTFDDFDVLDQFNNNFKGLKLNIKDVQAVYSYARGQVYDSYYGLFLLKNDNTVHGISLYSLITGKTQTTEISNLKGIVKFVTKSSDGNYTYAVDKDGREYDMINYVPDSYTKW